MKKQFLNLGKALNKAEQKTINGGMTEQECAKRGGAWYSCEDGVCLIGHHLPPCM